jgi:LTXXQ motif family protein
VSRVIDDPRIKGVALTGSVEAGKIVAGRAGPKAFVDARIAALKAGLELTPAQEKNWAPVEAAIRDQAKQRAERFAAWREKRKEQKGERPDPLERMQRFSEILATRADNLKALAQVSKPLYDSLDDAQKRRFGRLMTASLWSRHQGAWGEHHWRHADAEDSDGDCQIKPSKPGVVGS